MEDKGEITLLNKHYAVTKDGFGLTYVDGMPVAEWVESRSPEETVELARIGARIMKRVSKERLADMAASVEMPDEQWDMLSQLKDALDKE